MSISIGRIKENADEERRLALDAPTASKVIQSGHGRYGDEQKVAQQLIAGIKSLG